MKALQKQAEEVLEKARLDQMLSHAACNFNKIPGKTYHLYECVHKFEKQENNFCLEKIKLAINIGLCWV